MEKEFRLGRSLLPRPDSDRLVPIDIAEAVLMTEVSTAPGHITSAKLRRVNAEISEHLPRLLNREIQGIEVENRLYHVGHINVRGLFLVSPSAIDLDLPLHRIVVEFDGWIRSLDSRLSERARATLRKEWGVSRNGGAE